MRKAVFLTGGVLAVLLAIWLGMRHHEAGIARDVPGQPRDESRTGENAADRLGSPLPGSRQQAKPRATLVPAPKLMGDKVTVLEGTIDAHGSDKPVTLRELDGTIFSAANIDLHEDGSASLGAPLKVVSPQGGTMESGTGTLEMKKDGSFSTTGEFSFKSGNLNASRIEE